MKGIATVRACAMVLLAAVCMPLGLNGGAATAPAIRAGTRAGASSSGPGVLAEHRYRIVGKLRLALFWIGRDNVGSARMTWRSDGATSALTLLVGSDPERAPHGLNQWGYLREEVRSDRAEVFSLRSLGDDEAAPTTVFTLGDGPRFGVTCASVEEHDVNSTHTTVNARGVSYRMFDQLLDQIGASPQWQERSTPRPAGADAGFLTALQRAMRACTIGRIHPKGFAAPPAVIYTYNNAVYDLTTRGSESLGRTTVGTRTFDQLLRTDFSIRNRTTGDISKFGVTHSPDGASGSLPVQIFYQPSFWLRVELRLDDAVDVPPDPAADGFKLARIRAICANASH